ncbi:hypothetical protein MMC20_002623 [Loxospora ochrophaea]|nr:hypothetical protein [Loxospora ochrophaea]
METPIRLTFGVELEFCVQFDAERYRDDVAAAEGVLWGRHIDMLPNARKSKLSMVVRNHMIKELRTFGLLVNNIGQGYFDSKSYDKWTVATDGTIDPEYGCEGSDSDSCGIEVKSRILYYNIESVREVQLALSIINSRFSSFVNETCGLHVHVGNESRGFSLRTAKNLGTLVAVFERQFNSLHPEHRVFNEACTPPVQSLYEDQRNIFKVAKRIESQGSLEELLTWFGIGFTAYNMKNLESLSMKTIEFRQHEATLDPEVVSRWVALTCSLVGVSHHAGRTGFVELVNKAIQAKEFTLRDLLRGLGLYSLAAYYSRRGLYVHPIEPWHWSNCSEQDLEQVSTGSAIDFDSRTVQGEKSDSSSPATVTDFQPSEADVDEAYLNLWPDFSEVTEAGFGELKK